MEATNESNQQILLVPDLAHRLAAIDIGSNSMRLIVAEPLRDGTYRILDEERESTRLGRSLNSTGRLAPDAIEHTLTALRNFKKIAEGFQVAELRTIATCAVREAANGAELCQRAKEEVGVEIEVISSDLEAHLAFFSVQRAFDLTDKNTVVADIGGGSTEIVLASGGVIEGVYSTPLGAVRLTEQFPGSDQGVATPQSHAELIAAIDRCLRKTVPKPFFIPHLLIGSGGTFTSLGEMIMAAKGQQNIPIRGYAVTRAQVSHLLDRLRKLPVKARKSIPGLSPDRADIIVAGLAVIDRLMLRFHVNVLQIHSRGVRDGLLLTMIDQSLGHASEDPRDRETAVERFAAACSGDALHGGQVAKLAGRIYEQLVELFPLDPTDRPFLEAAARLQDVGYLINYDQHHKHSYHLILNSRLAGFRPRELELIANIARYHRGAEPKKRHENFAKLNKAERNRVRRLAAILRIAGGLDRSHTQQVRDVLVSRAENTLLFRAVAEENPEVDIWGARRRSEFFEQVFHVALAIDWQGAIGPPPNAAAPAVHAPYSVSADLSAGEPAR
ncbi:MAG TPA: Ppx/GppA phosphatase family protein [Pirellulales bacterium]|jgi:exopolyphosphatase/guanosine-5'-triphosphate,3'-diphosphate pyrophosphatase|nr:Ppx/GppA phosphatase family protein [Pirellulales bacterium]